MPGFGSADQPEGPAYMPSAQSFSTAVDKFCKQYQKRLEEAPAAANIATQFARLGAALQADGIVARVDSSGELYYEFKLHSYSPVDKLCVTLQELGLEVAGLHFDTLGEVAAFMKDGSNVVSYINVSTVAAFNAANAQLLDHGLYS